MKKYLFVLVFGLVILSFNVKAQTTIEFIYDESGNRISRGVLQLKSGSLVDTETQDKFLEPLEEQIGLQNARIYPNPTKGLLRIDFPSLGTNEATLRVFNSTGKLLIQRKATDIGNEINLFDFPSGFYILKVQVGQEKKDWKIIKE